MTRKRLEPMPKTAQQICLEQLPVAEAVIKDALAGMDILQTTLEAAIFVIEMCAEYQTTH